MQEPESYGKVKLSKVKAAIKQIEEHYQDCPERLEDVEVTFEYLVGSFFPKIVENIQKEMNKQYTLGYLQRVNEEKENTEE
jgi:chromosome segregation and condensation protein ScpB